MVQQLAVPTFVKIRLLDALDASKTIDLCKALEAAGVAAICVHGRTREQKGQNMGASSWDAIRQIRAAVNIPVIANGSVRNRAEAQTCLEFTGCAAVMSAEGLLENPSSFADELADIDDLMLELLEIYKMYPTPHLGCLKAHLFHALYTGLQTHTDLRKQLVQCRELKDYEQLVLAMKERRQGETKESKQGWYMRHREDQLQSEPSPETTASDENSAVAEKTTFLEIAPELKKRRIE
eukprot:Gregarina_sp_Poly_1__1178@NODE_128_length_13277_cov_115_450643_g114_i0_p8_GENE_NODE_128_length_13277_cov_115_450643_g114_i0NODE_128_length_13277_cov_115_450643_g114_i0_p8_ORF_typecomplete_len237_score45_74Dus/PF01207_17/2_1e34Oxidored_FMN/PF00724_20/5_9e07His_biosynth/PF00977_21/2_7e06ThiG/PF05690_14/4_5e05NanE/PF04131_14/0_00031FMN_dh/PF01070_18/0_00055DHO_dh/PF01180_21/0_0017TMPTENI/PF02581_17/0_0063SOR_SNZ/PF01680_17/0_0085PEP_mutase/PF13714_6/0_037G3P_antiterm/PF04309_12/4_6e03G3P_antiterm/P